MSYQTIKTHKSKFNKRLKFTSKGLTKQLKHTKVNLTND